MEDDFEVVPAVRNGCDSTVSIALPSSILTNAQSPELRVYLAGQIARAAAIYCIHEIIIFDEQQEPDQPRRRNAGRNSHRHEDPTTFFKLLLEYLETPQYLRRYLFPVSQDLRLVGLLNPLALPSHVARNESSRWREGVAVPRAGNARRNESAPTCYIAAGLERLVEVDQKVQTGERVTVDMSPSGSNYDSFPGKYLFGKLVKRSSPQVKNGLYWGYRVRTATCLSDVFQGSAICDAYDLAIGTSERGTPIVGDKAEGFALPAFSHLLIVFGGVHGLERSVRGDEKLQALGVDNENAEGSHGVADLFDFYVNTCPEQGSRTIRTEEAVLISLAALQPHLKPK